MKRIKVATIVGTRPEIIRLSRVLERLDRLTDHVLIHTGQNYDYELNEIFFKELEIKPPDYYLDAAGNTPAETIGTTIAKVDTILLRENPEATLVLGDTNSCLSVIAAKKRHIPIFHMEAGNRCFDERVPEEANRRIVDHLSDINLPYSDLARENLLREGLQADRIIKIGSPMYEVLKYYRNWIDSSNVLERLDVQPREFFVVSFHREENVEPDGQIERFVKILNHLVKEFGLPIVVSTHPRTQHQLDTHGAFVDPAVIFLKPFGFFDYVCLQMNAKAVLSDSGTVTEESSILGFPALNLRETHERPEGMEEGAVMMTGLDWNRIHQGLEVLFAHGEAEHERILTPSDYSVPNVSEKVLRIILSYTDYIRRVTWYELQAVAPG